MGMGAGKEKWAYHSGLQSATALLDEHNTTQRERKGELIVAGEAADNSVVDSEPSPVGSGR